LQAPAFLFDSDSSDGDTNSAPFPAAKSTTKPSLDKTTAAHQSAPVLELSRGSNSKGALPPVAPLGNSAPAIADEEEEEEEEEDLQSGSKPSTSIPRSDNERGRVPEKNVTGDEDSASLDQVADIRDNPTPTAIAVSKGEKKPGKHKMTDEEVEAAFNVLLPALEAMSDSSDLDVSPEALQRAVAAAKSSDGDD
jgi:hypothetical protein